MERTQMFLLDGKAYNVDVTKLVRKFSVLDSDKSGRTQDGQMYRDVIGTFYNYTMTISSRGADVAALDAFWEVVSRPDVSHVCEFPYGQDTLVQQMYVTGGEQELRLITDRAAYWNEITLNFIAMSPKVVP